MFWLTYTIAYLKLYFKGTLPNGAIVWLFKVIKSSAEIRGWYLSVSTDQCLQHSIMNKCILTLHEFKPLMVDRT